MKKVENKRKERREERRARKEERKIAEKEMVINVASVWLLLLYLAIHFWNMVFLNSQIL